MTPTDARNRLARMVAAATDPVVDEETLDDLLAANAALDDSGREPADPAWAGAWDLNAAAAEAWRLKAADAATSYSFTADGASYQRDAIFKHCLAMADHYAARAGTVIAGRTEAGGGGGWLQAVTTYTDPASPYYAPELLP
jgi:hypothetical protein